MKTYFKILLLCLFIAFCSCSSENQESKIVEPSAIPAGAFPIIYRNHLYINGRCDTVKGRFVFDTGADNFYFDSLFYNNSNLFFENMAVAVLPGVGSKPQKIKMILDTVKFKFYGNDYKTNNVPVLGLKEILGDIADGIFGKNYFSGKALEINYEHQFMKVHDRLDESQILGYSKIKIENINNRLYMPLKLRIKDSLVIEGDFTLDLGSGGSITLASPAAKQFELNKMIDRKIKYYTKYGGVSGESSSYIFKSESVLIGGYELNDFIMSYSEDEKGALSSNRNFGLLGNKILEKFDLIIDFKNNFLYLKPNAGIKKPFENQRLGFKYVDRSSSLGAWNVNGFYEGSHAEQSGLKIDDKITHVNNIPVNEISYNEQQELFRNSADITLTVLRNDKPVVFNIKLENLI